MTRRLARVPAALCAATLLIAVAAPAEDPPGRDPDSPGPNAEEQPPAAASSGLIEKTGVRLFLLDIEALEDDGRPMRGLQAADFVVRRNGRLWPVVSVDDFCACEPAPEPGGVAPFAVEAGAGVRAAPDATAPPDAVTTAPGAANAPPDARPPADRPLFILFIDFGQLGPDGRHNALAAARHWVREVRGEDEPAMIEAYVTSRGLVTLSQPTADGEELLRVLDAADRDPVLIDQFAYDMKRRIDDCEKNREPGICTLNARQEYAHGRRSLEAFRQFLTRLAGRPGPKVVLYFHENGMMAPGPLYFQSDDQNHYLLAEAVGAEATAARAAVYPLLAGMEPAHDRMRDQIRGLGATLAEATGGTYNLGQADFARLAAGAGRGCRCRYVLGLEPVEAFSRSVSTVTVTARGRRLPAVYRMRLMADEDVWLRQASAVLDTPASAQDIPVGAALVPVRPAGKGWDVEAQVAVDLRALVLIPRGVRHEGRWEIGARLARLDGRGTWDMLATSVASAGATGAPDAVLLHARTFTGLRPGRYRLAAFVRDRVANIFGGAEALVELPDPKRGGVAGPVMLADRALRVRSPLPLVSENAAGIPGGVRAAEVTSPQDSGPAPPAALPVRRGAILLFESWLCSAPGAAPFEAVTHLSRDDVALFRLTERAATPAGAEEAGAATEYAAKDAPAGRGEARPAGASVPCRRRVDEVPTGPLEPGRYLYTLRRRSTDTGTVSWPVSFVVAPPAAPGD